jgi:hypothetical protein
MKVMTSPSSIDPLIMQRLAFIRMLHQQGNEQAQLPDPMRATCILTLHDAVELFLVLVGDHLRANLSPRLDFMAYWAEIQSKANVQLTSKTAMDRLNRRRVDFKHHGNLPSTESLVRVCADVSTFFEENTPLVFGIDYDAIDMADVIPQATTRALAKQATTEEGTGNRTEAMALLSDAFEDLFRQHAKTNSYPPSPFAFGPDIRFPLRKADIRRALPDDRLGYASRLTDQISDVTVIASATQTGLRVMSLGVDFHRYVRFRQLMPHVHHGVAGNREVHPPSDYAPTAEHLRFCMDFLITVALRLVEIETYTTPPAWTR